jgi:glutamine synthetase
MPPSREDILKMVSEEEVAFIDLWFTDITGVVKNVTIPAAELEDALTHGVWFDGSSIQGFARIAESDMLLMPIPETFRVLPWHTGDEKTARFICDLLSPNGEMFEGDPRYALKRVVEEAEEMGFKCQAGPELEFFLFKPHADGSLFPLQPHDAAGYFDVSTDQASGIRRQMVNALHAMGIQVEALHHEVAIGQHEIDFRYSDVLSTADNAVTYRVTLKAVAQFNNLYCTFMPKPIPFINGSGMHTHQSLIDLETGKNAFYDPDDEYGLSKVAKHFIAGQLRHARGFAAIVAPLVNSYKRLVPGYEAPVYVSWARTNRSALIRVPKVSVGRTESTRLELRCPDPSCNPYLAFAAIFKAGLDGIKNEMQWPDALEEDLFHLDEEKAVNVETLPGSLDEALDALAADDVIKEALGDHIYNSFVAARVAEFDDYRLQVTQWELDRYLPRF